MRLWSTFSITLQVVLAVLAVFALGAGLARLRRSKG